MNDNFAQIGAEFLAQWPKFSQSVEARDHFIKFIFYSSKFFNNQSNFTQHSTLSNIMNTASLSRKAFRLFKSLNYISDIIDITDYKNFESTEFLTILEKFLYVILLKNYFYYL